LAGGKSSVDLGKFDPDEGNPGMELGKSAPNGCNPNMELGNFTVSGGNPNMELGKSTANGSNFTTDGGNSVPYLTKRKKDVIEFEFGDSGKHCFMAVQIENEGKKGPRGPLTSALIP
jgi:hypothetical protein